MAWLTVLKECLNYVRERGLERGERRNREEVLGFHLRNLGFFLICFIFEIQNNCTLYFSLYSCHVVFLHRRQF